MPSWGSPTLGSLWPHLAAHQQLSGQTDGPDIQDQPDMLVKCKNEKFYFSLDWSKHHFAAAAQTAISQRRKKWHFHCLNLAHLQDHHHPDSKLRVQRQWLARAKQVCLLVSLSWAVEATISPTFLRNKKYLILAPKAVLTAFWCHLADPVSLIRSAFVKSQISAKNT